MATQRLDDVPDLAVMAESSVEPSDIELRHFVLLTEPQREFAAAKGLRRLGFDPYVPAEVKLITYGTRSIWGTTRRKREVTLPIFRGYLFLPLNRAWSFGPIYRVDGLRPNGHCFLVHNGRHVTVSDRDIAIMHGVEKALAETAVPGCHYKPGDKVKHIDGPFADIVMTIASLDDAGRIELLSDLFKGSSKLFANARQIMAA